MLSGFFFFWISVSGTFTLFLRWYYMVDGLDIGHTFIGTGWVVCVCRPDLTRAWPRSHYATLPQAWSEADQTQHRWVRPGRGTPRPGQYHHC